MKTNFIWGRVLLTAALLLSPVLAEPAITLEQIMQHPRWIGQWPEELRYSPNGQSIFYLAHGDPRGYQVVEITQTGEVEKSYNTSALPTSRDTSDGRGLYSFLGDLFLTGAGDTRLTRTESRESECRWLDSHRFVFRRGDDYFVHDLSTDTERQVANLLFKDAPKPAEDFRSKEQDRLFPLLKQREEAPKETAAPKFYLGDGRSLVRLEVHPKEQWALAVHRAQDNTEPDKMPVYLNRDGSVTTRELRAKVGAVTPSDTHLSVLDLRAGTQRDINLSSLPGFTPKTTVYVDNAAWSKNGRLALSLFSENFKDRWIVEALLPEAKVRLVEHLHDDAWQTWDLNEFGWTADNNLWYQSEKTGWAQLYLWNGSQSKAITSGKFEVTSIHPAPDGKAFFYRANKENPGRYDVFRTDLSGKTEQITRLGGQTTFDLSADGKQLAILHSTTATPPEIYLQPTRAGAAAQQITHLASKEFLSIDWTLPQFVDVPSTHQARPIRSKLYLPPKGTPQNGAAVVFVHGAGYLQNSDEGWSYYFREFMFHTMLTRQGVTVLDMDYRASAGYGRDWRTAIYRHMGTPELEDLEDGVAYLVAKHGVQADRVGVYGGSYGGFMTLMALFKDPDLFACGAALRPVSDWAEYEHEYTGRILNTPDEDPESYLASSPIEFAEGLKKPLLICHGLMDDNVVAQDTIRLTQRLIQLKKKNWETALYPVESHGFIEPESWLDEYRRVYKLFRENLHL